MPSWKKVIISGSAAELSSLYAPSITGSLQGTSSFAVTASYALTSSFSLAASANQILVINKSGNTITKGTVVHLTGSANSSDTPYITTASYESDNLSANTLGIAYETIAFNATGYVTTEGVLTGLNVTGYQAGQVVYLGATGSITGSAPLAPLHSVRLGQVVRDSPSNNGSIYVRIDNGYEIGELHDVTDTTTTASYGDLLVKSGSVWINSRQLTGSYALTGSLIVTGSTSGNLVRITQTGTGNAFVIEDADNPDTSPFVVNASGNVGVGTTTPAAKFEIKSAAQNNLGGLLLRAAASANYPALIYETTNQSGVLELYSGSTLTTQFHANGNSFLNGGNVGIGTTTPSASLHVMGNTLITGSLTVGSSSLGPSENTITLGARDNGSEGGQLGFNAPGSTYTSASMIDLYQNRLRVLKGTNAGSTAEVAWWNMHNSQMALPTYTSTGSYPGTAAGYLAFDSSGNIITAAGVGSAVNIGNSNLTITSDAFRVLSHAGNSRFTISGSTSNALLELNNTTTGNSRVFSMREQLNGETNRNSVRNFTAAGNNADDSQHNGWISDHIAEFVSGSAVAINRLRGWKWSYYTEDPSPIYKDILLISTSNEATLNASLTVTGSTYLPGLTSGTTSNVVYIDTVTGALSYGAAASGSSSGSAFPYTGSAQITGSLGITGSLFVTGSTATDLVRITQAGSGNAFTVYDINSDTTPFVINSSGSVGIGTPTPSSYTARLIVLADSNGTSGIRSTGFGNHAIIGNGSTNYAGVYGESVGDDAGEYFGGYFKSYQADTPINTNTYIGAKFEAISDATNYSVQLKDGTQAAGKVLVSQDASGSANWSTRLSGSYEVTGSLTTTGSLTVTGSIYGTELISTTNQYGDITIVTPALVSVESNNGANAIIQKVAYTNTTGIDYTPVVTKYYPRDISYTARGIDSTSYNQLIAGNVLNAQEHWGYDGIEYGIGYHSYTMAFGTWDNASHPTIWRLQLTPSGSTTLVNRMEIDDVGNLTIDSPTTINADITVTGSYNSTSGNSIDNNAFIQAGLLYLSNNF